MAWTVDEIKKELLRIEKETQDKKSNVSNIPIIISSKMKNNAGAFFFSIDNQELKPLKFQFSSILFKSGLSDEYIINEIRHEYVHYYISLITNENHNHDKIFQTYCTLFNVKKSSELLKKESFQTRLNIIKKRYNYVLICNRCNKIIGFRINKPIRINECISTCCQAAVQYKTITNIDNINLIDLMHI